LFTWLGKEFIYFEKVFLLVVTFLLIGLGCGDDPENIAKQILEAMVDGNHSEALQYVD